MVYSHSENKVGIFIGKKPSAFVGFHAGIGIGVRKCWFLWNEENRNPSD